MQIMQYGRRRSQEMISPRLRFGHHRSTGESEKDAFAMVLQPPGLMDLDSEICGRTLDNSAFLPQVLEMRNMTPVKVLHQKS